MTDIHQQHPATLEPEELLRQCQIRRQRRSGPGGQHRNKVETAVILRHSSTGTEAEANERRSQAENRRVAVNRLRINLALHVRCLIDRKSGPGRLWRSRCRGKKIAVSRRSKDFAAILAEALDVVFALGADVRAAAEFLDCSPSQLVKLLKEEPRALSAVNGRRVEEGLKRLK